MPRIEWLVTNASVFDGRYWQPGARLSRVSASTASVAANRAARALVRDFRAQSTGRRRAVRGVTLTLTKLDAS
jgi:hypothetical protein